MRTRMQVKKRVTHHEPVDVKEQKQPQHNVEEEPERMMTVQQPAMSRCVQDFQREPVEAEYVPGHNQNIASNIPGLGFRPVVLVPC